MCTVSAIALISATASEAGQLPATAFLTYNPATASGIQAGPFSLYQAAVNTIAPTQLNLGFTEVGKKVSAYDLLSPAGLANDLLTGGSIEPVVIGPGGVLYLTNGHHTFTALTNSIYGAANPSVYVNVIANYSMLTPTQFWAQMQASNFLLPLDNGVIKSVDPLTGAPIPSSFAGMTNDPYRGLEYSILKNKSSKLFTTTGNITGAVGSSIPGLDKTAAFYSDFIWANAYRGANSSLGLAYLSPGDIAIATRWNLTGTNQTTLTGIGSVTVAQLPGYILSSTGSIVINGTVTDATLANGVLDGTRSGTFDQSSSFASFNGLRGLNLGTVTIGSTAPGFIMQLGNDSGGTVSLTGSNSYTGGTTILAGTLSVNGDAALGAARPLTSTIDPNNLLASVQAANGVTFNSLSEGKGTLQVSSSFSTNRPIAVSSESAILSPQGAGITLTLAGEIVSVGTAGTGLGSATGESDLSVNASAATGMVKLAPSSGSNALFYGNWIVSKGILQASSDAALGNTTGPSYSIGQIVLDGGTFQPGASFASVRSLYLTGGSSFDTNGFTTSFAGSMTDVQRTLTVINSSTTTAGAVTFGSLDISGTSTASTAASTSTLVLTGGTAGETVTLTNGIKRADHSTLLIAPTSAATNATLGVTEKVLSGTAPALTNGIVSPWTLIDLGAASVSNGAAAGNNRYNFATYNSISGFGVAAYSKTGLGSAGINASTATDVVEQTGASTLTAGKSAYALKLDSGAVITATGQTLTLGDGSNPAGLILGGSSAAITGGTLAFGGSEAAVFVRGTTAVSSTLTGTNGLTLSGSGTLTLSSASAGLTGPVDIASGTLNLTAVDALINAGSINLSNVKSSPSAAILTLSASNTIASLNSAGNNSTITLTGSGTVLTIGETANATTALNNLDSTLSSTVTDTAVAAGNSAIVKAGSGLLDLSGATLTLTTGSNIAVNAGKLRVAASSFTNTNNLVTASGSEVQFAQNGGGKFGGNITGGGVMHLIGGTLQLTGTGNSYSGGTVVEQGSTLDLTTANISTGNANIANAGGLIVFDQATTGTYAGIISDARQMQATTGALLSGSLIKDDSTGASTGNLILAAVQAYTGGTFIEAGTVTLAAIDAIAASSGVDLGRVGGPAGIGAATTGSATTAILALSANNTIRGLMSETGNVTAVQLNANALTLNTAANAIWTYDGNISGTGALVKTGAGKEVLSGTSSYTGATTVNAGILSVNGSIAASSLTSVNAGGTLGGNGSVGNTMINGGMLSPGNSIGLLTVQGNLVLTSAASYLVEVSSTTADRTNVSGTAALAGTLLVSQQGTLNFGKAYTILSAGGGLLGQFSTTSLANPLIAAAVSYTSTDAVLSLGPNLLPYAGNSINQRNVAAALQFGLRNGDPGAFSALFNLSPSALPGVITQLSGETTVAAQQTTFDAMRQFTGAMLDSPFDAAASATPTGAAAFAAADDRALNYASTRRHDGSRESSAYAMITKALPRPSAELPQWTVWAAGFGGSQTTDGNAASGANATTSRIYGTAVGANYRISPNTIAGFALAGGGTNFSVGNGGTGRSDLFQAGAFVRHSVGQAYIAGSLAYGWQQVSTDRTVAFTGPSPLSARFDANAYSARVESGYRLAASWLDIGLTPYAAGQFTTFDLPAYSEQTQGGSGALALAYAAKSITDARSEFGLRSDTAFTLENTILSLRGRLAWAHDYNTDRSVSATFLSLPGATFVVNGATRAADSALVTAALENKWRNGIVVGASFESELSSTTRSYAGRGVMRYEW
jgi:autotransporter-associated beta strand protein